MVAFVYPQTSLNPSLGALAYSMMPSVNLPIIITHCRGDELSLSECIIGVTRPGSGTADAEEIEFITSGSGNRVNECNTDTVASVVCQGKSNII